MIPNRYATLLGLSTDLRDNPGGSIAVGKMQAVNRQDASISASRAGLRPKSVSPALGFQLVLAS